MSGPSVQKLGKDLTSASDVIKNLSVQFEQACQDRLKEIENREEQWAMLQKKLEEQAAKAPTKITLDVGGKKFAVAKSTLLSVPDTFFTAMLGTDTWKPDADGRYFIDRDPKLFARILSYLRTGKLKVADLHPEQLASLKDELDFFQISIPANTTELKFIIKGGYTASNNNRTITKSTDGHTTIRADSPLLSNATAEWTIRIENIVNSHWFAVGVAHKEASSYKNMYCISSINQVYPINTGTSASGDWQTGDLIHVSFDIASVTITNKRTGRSHAVKIPPNSQDLYPTFDIYSSGLSISFV